MFVAAFDVAQAHQLASSRCAQVCNQRLAFGTTQAGKLALRERVAKVRFVQERGCPHPRVIGRQDMIRADEGIRAPILPLSQRPYVAQTFLSAGSGDFPVARPSPTFNHTQRRGAPRYNR